MISQVIAAVLICGLVGQSSAGYCSGHATLKDSMTGNCWGTTDIDTVLTCLQDALDDDDRSCSVDTSCFEINIGITSGSLAANADGKKIKSFGGCYAQTMIVELCDGPAQGGNGGGDGVTAEGVTDSEVMTTDDGVTDEPSTGKCATGTVMFDSAACVEGETQTATLTLPDDSTVEVDVYVVSCSAPLMNDSAGSLDCLVCEGDDCSGNNVPTKKCEACWTYILKEGDTSTTTRGCLADLSLDDAGSSFSPATCNTNYKQGTCTDITDGEECLKCCTGASCNTHVRSSIIDPKTTPGAASSLAPLFTLMLTALIAKLI